MDNSAMVASLGPYTEVIEDLPGKFRVRWRYWEHWANVEAFEITAFTDASFKTPLFNLKDAMSLPAPVLSIDEAETYLEGHVKWDGCTELNMGQPHWCGARGYRNHCELLRYIFTRAQELLPAVEPELFGQWPIS